MSDLLTERKTPQRLRELNLKFDCGIISAFKTDDDSALPFDENMARNTELFNTLRNWGYGVIKTVGMFFGKEEQSLFVVDYQEKGKLLERLRMLGRKYEQDSIIYSPKGGRDARFVKTTKEDHAKESPHATSTTYNSKEKENFTVVDKRKRMKDPNRTITTQPKEKKFRNFVHNMDYSFKSKLPEARKIAIEAYKAGLRKGLMG